MWRNKEGDLAGICSESLGTEKKCYWHFGLPELRGDEESDVAGSEDVDSSGCHGGAGWCNCGIGDLFRNEPDARDKVMSRAV